MTDQPDEELRRALERAERELIERLEEPCDLVPEEPGEESTGQLLHLEDTLLAAARAAERVIELRRRCRDNGLTPRGERALRDQELPVPPASESVREFRAPDGSEWRAWAVRPQASRSKGIAQRFLADYQHGWLAFESLDGVSRRRLPGIPRGWAQGGEAKLRELFESACPAKQQRRAGERTENAAPAAGEAFSGGQVRLRQDKSTRQAEGAAG